MRKFALTFIALVFCGTLAYAGPEAIRSSSKEMKETVEPVAPACDFTWTGFYLGGFGGGAWGDGDTHFFSTPPTGGFIDTTLHPDTSGGFGGGLIGFNWQVRRFVFGVETDFAGGDIGGSEVSSPILLQPGSVSAGAGSFLYTDEDLNWFGTFRGRIGFAPFCRLLIYGTGGLAYGNVDDRAAAVVQIETYPASVNETNVGWAAGGGLEIAITRHWTIKAEYLYMDLGDERGTGNPIPPNPPFLTHFRWDNDFHTIKGGLNFKF